MDMAQGYGGKYGVQTDRKDKSALGWDEKVELAQHESQKGFLNYILLILQHSFLQKPYFRTLRFGVHSNGIVLCNFISNYILVGD